MTARILAIGGGGFLMDSAGNKLDRYFLQCIGKSVPKICFIPTASGDSEAFLSRFYAAFASESCELSHLAFFRPPRSNAISLANIDQLLEQDAIYVGGGNTKAMLAVWREWNLDEILKEAWRSGILLAGMSAGAICWFDHAASDVGWFGQLRSLPGLGLLRGSCTPHYDGELNRRPQFHQLIESGELFNGIGIDDDAAVLFEEQQIVEVVASKPTAKAYRVELRHEEIHEEPLPTRYLEN